MLPRKQNYSTIEKECLATKLGVQAFKVCLLGNPVEIQTDHRALKCCGYKNYVKTIFFFDNFIASIIYYTQNTSK